MMTQKAASASGALKKVEVLYFDRDGKLLLDSEECELLLSQCLAVAAEQGDFRETGEKHNFKLRQVRKLCDGYVFDMICVG